MVERERLVVMFNDKFDASLSVKALRSMCYRLGIKGRNTKFQLGDETKKKADIGQDRLTTAGYVETKTEDGWVLKQRLVWQEHNGDIPEGHVIAFRDGDKQNVEIDNLYLLSRREALYINRVGLSSLPVEMAETALLIAKISLKRIDLERSMGEEDEK